MNMNEDKYLLSSVYNTLSILDLLSTNNEMGITEISNSTGLSKSSVFRMMYTLEKKEFVYKTSTSKYRLGIKLAYYGSIVTENLNVFNVIKPFLQSLRDVHNETTHLGILDEDLNVIFMAKEPSTATIQMTSKVGYKLPFYISAMGKILAANRMDHQLLEKLKNYNFVKYTSNTITEYEKIIEMLSKVRDQNYSVDEEESEEGLTCIAVPVRDFTGNTVAAISISGPTLRIKRNWEYLINDLKSTGDEASLIMGYRE
ncbi:IclR family transcriptional regulator [Gudongella sp. DL1XJH-153]|uniref:IclR family transcriptional regulator n=1 Tax=Gudongella sp. DL1XJH-153 TaxID=3409804 RepID=UPI003BB6845F